MSCLVNPRACRETELQYLPALKKKRIIVVGSGLAGLSFSTIAAMRGHEVTLFEQDSVIVCAGQEPVRDLEDELARQGMPVYVIGGAELAVELDAKRAIDQGVRLAAGI